MAFVLTCCLIGAQFKLLVPSDLGGDHKAGSGGSVPACITEQSCAEVATAAPDCQEHPGWVGAHPPEAAFPFLSLIPVSQAAHSETAWISTGSVCVV